MVWILMLLDGALSSATDWMTRSLVADPSIPKKAPPFNPGRCIEMAAWVRQFLATVPKSKRAMRWMDS